jgi:hypothetical protein
MKTSLVISFCGQVNASITTIRSIRNERWLFSIRCRYFFWHFFDVGYFYARAKNNKLPNRKVTPGWLFSTQFLLTFQNCVGRKMVTSV